MCKHRRGARRYFKGPRLSLPRLPCLGTHGTHRSQLEWDLGKEQRKAMYSGICICVLLALLSVSSFGQQALGSHNGNPVPAELEQSLTEPHRHVRAPSAGPLKPLPRLDGSSDQRANIGALLAKYLQQARKGSTGRFSVMGNRVQSIDPTHRINDRDYMGWMDFGRRSAEEYEYSS